MNLERWKWRSSLGLTTGQASGRQDDTERRQWLEPAKGKAPRVLTRALRSLSSSSMDSSASSSIKSSHSTRCLQKSPSNTESIIGRLHRRVSRDFSGSIISAASGPIIDALPPYSAMAVLDYGPLKADVSLLKARSEYLVLSDQCLIKFASGEAARSAFPQLIRASIQPSHVSPHRQNSTKSASGDARLEIPLQAIVAAFDEDGPNQRAGIEVWWLSQWPRLAYFKTHLHFTLVKERDYWLTSIHRACRARLRKSSGVSLIPENLKARIHHIVQATEGVIDEAPQNLIFPVARCVFGPAPKSSSADEAHDNTETSSYYFVIGQCMCHLIEVCKADYSTAPGDLRAKATSCGTVTLIRLKASIASNEQRFIMCFRSPFGSELRLDLASVQYRRIIEALTKADRILKPMWPQHFQQAIFDVRGLAPPLQLTSGNDLGGLRKSLQAYSAAYHVRVPRWNIEWNTHPQPAFRLLPLQEGSYSPLQLIAVFRALRYNSFFKAISFRDVDLSPLMGKNDHPRYGENVAYRSLNGLSISEDHHEILVQASILEQEMHALTFASESIRNIDMENVLGLRSTDRNPSRLKCDLGSLRAMISELLRPMLMLWRKQLCACHSITLSGNPLALSDIDEFSNLLLSDCVHFKKLHLARCALGDAGLTKLWKGLEGQIHSLEFLDTSDNQGTVRFDIIQNTLKQLARITRLRITGNTRIPHGQSLFDAETMSLWALQELDLSEIVLNDNTVDILTNYLASDQSCKIEAICLNNCGLTGAQVSRLFRGMGQARRVAVHLNANRLDQGIDDLCGAIACGYGPWCLFLQMTEFALEVNYIKLMRALTVNKTIQCLNLAGTAIPDAASTTNCQTIADFFSKNSTVRFLDISGFDSKLDEGRLGKEFSRALGGIRSNTGIEHFRVRSQMLNVNIGDLAEAVSANKTIHTLDCQGNDFNLYNFRHIVKNLAGNTTIRYFSAFSAQELSRAIGKSTQNASPGLPARRHSMISLFRHDKVQSTWGNAEIQNEWDDALAELQQILKRNQDLFEKHERSHSGFVSRTRRDCDTDHGFSLVFGGLARRDFESRRAKGLQDSAVSRTIFESTVQPGSNGLGEEGPRPRSSISSDLVLSPSITDGASALDAPSPLEPESPNKNQDSPIEEGRTVTVLDEVQDSNYTFCKDFDADVGAQMKYQRFLSGSTSRIEEEEDGIELELTQTQSDRC